MSTSKISELRDGFSVRLNGIKYYFQPIIHKMPDAPGTIIIEQQFFKCAPMQILVAASVDDTPKGPLLHVSMSKPTKDPSWAEIKAIKTVFFGDDVDCMMVIPKAKDYINLHQHTFHLWQTPTEWGIL